MCRARPIGFHQGGADRGRHDRGLIRGRIPSDGGTRALEDVVATLGTHETDHSVSKLIAVCQVGRLLLTDQFNCTELVGQGGADDGLGGEIGNRDGAVITLREGVTHSEATLRRGAQL